MALLDQRFRCVIVDIFSSWDVGKDDIGALREVGWKEREIWEITALTSFFNFSGRLEAASGLPPDEIPAQADFAEGRANLPH